MISANGTVNRSDISGTGYQMFSFFHPNGMRIFNYRKLDDMFATEEEAEAFSIIGIKLKSSNNIKSIVGFGMMGKTNPFDF